MSRILASLLLAVVLCVSAGQAQQDFSKVQMKSTKVAGNIYMLEGSGGNIGVSAGGDGILIIDDQYAPLSEKIRAALKEINPGNLKFILNTHWHGDHTGSNAVFGPEAPIVAHTNVRKRLEAGSNNPNRVVPPAAKEALPVITYDQSVSIHFNGEEIRVMHYPQGHTDGDSIIFFTKSNVVHMGDDFFAGSFPFVDLDSGGSVEGLIKNIQDVIARVPADVKIIPGHGPLSTLDDLKKYHRMLVETTGLVSKKMKEGKKLQQLQAEGFPDEWKDWGKGFVNANRWIETIHRSLSKK
jgi:glyoxylase-like metal-dependent hydrolase (beta-lactamase superfamily II)